MYGAYYPYLYGRGAARSLHAPHFQYERLNVQGGHNVGGEGYGGAVASSPPLLHHRRAKEEDLSHSRTSEGGGGSSESEGESGCGGARAQYVSANCVVFTHYAGDVAAVVDQHFARALNADKHKESAPMASRNLPPSFFNAATPSGMPSCAAGVELYDYDPWHQHYGYGGAAHRHEYAHHAAAAGYGGLLLPRQLHQYKQPLDWQHLDTHYSYPPVHGLEAPVQDTSKDLYWF